MARRADSYLAPELIEALADALVSVDRANHTDAALRPCREPDVPPFTTTAGNG